MKANSLKTFFTLLTFSLIVILPWDPAIQAASHEHHDEHDDHHDEHSDHHDEHGSQKAHLHGYAEMTVAIEGNKLEINLDSPSANIVGFEHKASNDDQIKTVEAAESVLKTPNKMFFFNGTNCIVSRTSVDISAVLEEHHDEHDDHHDEHSDHHGEGEDVGHKNGEEIHSDIEANYKFSCDDGSKLISISMILFNHFPAIEKLKTDWIKGNKQGSLELSSDSRTVIFR